MPQILFREGFVKVGIDSAVPVFCSHRLKRPMAGDRGIVFLLGSNGPAESQQRKEKGLEFSFHGKREIPGMDGTR